MKRVLVLIKGLGRGGAEQLIATSSRYWDRTKFQYEVAYLLSGVDNLAHEIEANDVNVSCLHGGNSVSWLPRLRDLLTERDIDLLHIHSPVAASAARLVCPDELPIVYTEHNVWPRYRRPTYWANMVTFSRNRHVFTVSDGVRNSIRYALPLRNRPMPPVETLYHGIDPQDVPRWNERDSVRRELGLPEDMFVFGTVANFKEHKGYPMLIKAAADVTRAAPNVKFVLVGAGPLESHIRAQVRHMRLEEKVLFLGYREDAARVTSAFDVFALASINEGLSIALIEAMSLGKPAVVTRAGGLPEVVQNGKQGFVVPVGNHLHFAAALLSLWRNRSLRTRLGESARERATFFDIKTAVRRQEEVYYEILRDSAMASSALIADSGRT